MEIKLNATELEAAVVSHLSNEGIDLKNKTIDFEFEGTCSINIEVDESIPVDDTKAKPKAKTTRAKRKPKAEPVKDSEPETNRLVPKEAEEKVAVAEVAEKLEEQTKPVEKEEPTEPEAEASKANDNSIFA